MERVELGFPHGYLFSNRVAFDLQLLQLRIREMVLTFAFFAPEIELVQVAALL